MRILLSSQRSSNEITPTNFFFFHIILIRLLIVFFSFSHNVKTECCLFGTLLHAKVKSASFYQAILCETIPGLNIPAAASY